MACYAPYAPLPLPHVVYQPHRAESSCGQPKQNPDNHTSNPALSKNGISECFISQTYVLSKNCISDFSFSPLSVQMYHRINRFSADMSMSKSTMSHSLTHSYKTYQIPIFIELICLQFAPISSNF